MKHCLLFIGCCCMFNTGWGQTIRFSKNAVFDSVVVVPTNPTDHDSVQLIIYISSDDIGDNTWDKRIFWPSHKEDIDSSEGVIWKYTKPTISNDSVFIYQGSMRPTDFKPVLALTDTAHLGKLKAGLYKILLINRETSGYIADCVGCRPHISYIDTARFILPINIK